MSGYSEAALPQLLRFARLCPIPLFTRLFQGRGSPPYLLDLEGVFEGLHPPSTLPTDLTRADVLFSVRPGSFATIGEIIVGWSPRLCRLDRRLGSDQEGKP